MLEQATDSLPEPEALSPADLVHVYARPGATCTVADDRGVCIELHVKVASGDAFVAAAIAERLRRGARVSGRVHDGGSRPDDDLRRRGHRGHGRRSRRRAVPADRDGRARRRAGRPALHDSMRAARLTAGRDVHAGARPARHAGPDRRRVPLRPGVRRRPALLARREPRPAVRGRGRRDGALPDPGACARSAPSTAAPGTRRGSWRSVRSTSCGSTALCNRCRLREEAVAAGGRRRATAPGTPRRGAPAGRVQAPVRPRLTAARRRRSCLRRLLAATHFAWCSRAQSRSTYPVVTPESAPCVAGWNSARYR